MNLARRKDTMGVVVIVERQSDLLEVVFALRASCGFTSLLDCRQQQGNQH